MNGRRIYHARGKVLGGSSSINGMIFQRGNPLDLERWAADPGMAEWSYAHCLPYFKRMETCLAGADEFRGGSGPLQLERGPATNPLFKAFFEVGAAGRLRAHRRRQRLPAGGLRPLRPQHPARPAPQRRGRVPAPGDEPAQPRRQDPRAHDEDRVRRHARGRRRVHDRASARTAADASSARWAARSSAAAARSTRRSCSSCRASATRPISTPLGITVVHDLRRRRRAHAGPPRGLHPAPLHATRVDGADAREVAAAVDRDAVAGAARARARRTISRRVASRAATTRASTPT